MNHEWSLYTNSVLLLYHPYLDRIMNQNLWESKIVSHRYFIFSQLNQPYDFFPTRFIRLIAAKFWALCQNTFVVHYSHRIRAPKKGYFQRYQKCFGQLGQISQNNCKVFGVFFVQQRKEYLGEKKFNERFEECSFLHQKT